MTRNVARYIGARTSRKATGAPTFVESQSSTPLTGSVGMPRGDRAGGAFTPRDSRVLAGSAHPWHARHAFAEGECPTSNRAHTQTCTRRSAAQMKNQPCDIVYVVYIVYIVYRFKDERCRFKDESNPVAVIGPL